jgi:hypothetical protein
MNSAFMLESKCACNEAGPVYKNKLFIYKLYWNVKIEHKLALDSVKCILSVCLAHLRKREKL